MNATDVMQLAELIQRASQRVEFYLKLACGPYVDDGYFESMAVSYARMAGHYANALIDLAERGQAV